MTHKQLSRQVFFASASAFIGLGAIAAPSFAQPSGGGEDVAQSSPQSPPKHTTSWPSLGTGADKATRNASLQLSPQYDRGITASEKLAERRRLDASLAALSPQRPGVVDSYVISIALDSDPVFGKEAREAGRVLSRRYNADGRTLVLAGPDGVSSDEAGAIPKGSIHAFDIALASLAEVMDRSEDVLIIYTTSHGVPPGLTYHYGDSGYGILSPQHFRDSLTELGIKKRVLILSACFSGVFVPYLASSDTAILTAAAFNRSSFGCKAENDWTFFGDALINNALRKNQSLGDAAKEAHKSIADWEEQLELRPSLPQLLIGEGAKTWLPALEAGIPRRATRPVGRPSVDN